MADYRFQSDFSHPEIKKSAGGSILFYPEVDGSGSIQVSSAIANIYRGSTSIGTATVTITNQVVHDLTGSKLSIPISAGQEYDDDYRVELEWTRQDNSQVEYTTIPFSVVYQPWGNSSVSLDDMVSVSMVSGTIDTIAQEQGKKGREVASQFGAYAHSMLDDWIRGKSLADGKVRAGAILDRSRLHKVETKLAVAMVWGHVMNGDPGDQATSLYDRWMNDAKNAFNALGNLRYDSSDDGAPDTTVGTIRQVDMERIRR